MKYYEYCLRFLAALGMTAELVVRDSSLRYASFGMTGHTAINGGEKCGGGERFLAMLGTGMRRRIFRPPLLVNSPRHSERSEESRTSVSTPLIPRQRGRDIHPFKSKIKLIILT